MEGFWQSPEVQGGVIPFATALVLALAIRLAGGQTWGPRLAILGAALGFLAAYWLLESVTWPAVSAKQKVFWLAALAVLLGVLLEVAGGRRAGTLVVAHLFPLVALLWLAWRQIERGPSSELLIALVALYVASLVVVWMLDSAMSSHDHDARHGGGHVNAAALLLLAGFAAGAISLFGAEIGMAQLSVAIGAVMGGVLLPSYLLYLARGEALKFGPIGIVGVGGAWLTCVYVMVLYGSSVSFPALAVLLLTFLLNIAARRIRVGESAAARLLEPVLYGAIVAIPAVAAVVYVVLTAEPETGY
jgi:hypothetical protein